MDASPLHRLAAQARLLRDLAGQLSLASEAESLLRDALHLEAQARATGQLKPRADAAQ